MKYILTVLVILAILGVGGYFAIKKSFTSGGNPTPTLEPAQQLPPEKQPKVSMEFSPDSHYVTLSMVNVHAAKVEYQIIYDAKIKRKGEVKELNTGVSGGSTPNKDSKTYTSSRQLLGSESSGKITYHEDIKNSVLDITLRDDRGRSVFKSSYPFTFTPGRTQNLN